MQIEPFLKNSQPNHNTIDGFISSTKLNTFRNVPNNRSRCKPSREEISANRNTRFVVFVKVVIVAVALADLGARNGLVPVQWTRRRERRNAPYHSQTCRARNRVGGGSGGENGTEGYGFGGKAESVARFWARGEECTDGFEWEVKRLWLWGRWEERREETRSS